MLVGFARQMPPRADHQDDVSGWVRQARLGRASVTPLGLVAVDIEPRMGGRELFLVGKRVRKGVARDPHRSVEKRFDRHGREPGRVDSRLA